MVFFWLLVCVVSHSASALEHHCVEEQTVTLMPSCVFGWQDGDERTSLVDPWVGGRMNTQSPAREQLGSGNCVGGQAKVVSITHSSSGHVKIACQNSSGEERQYWVNPQFLSCGEMMPTEFMPIHPGTACASLSDGPAQTVGLSARDALPVSLGEVNGANASTDPSREAFIALENSIQRAADRALTASAVGQLLKQASVQNLGNPLRNQIVQNFPEAFSDVQNQREVDLKMIQSRYLTMDGNATVAALEKSVVKISEQSAELERSFGANCRVDSLRTLITATEVSLADGIIKPNQVRNTALEKTCQLYRLASAEGVRWAQLDIENRKRIQEEWKGELFRSASAADDRTRAIRLLLLYGTGEEDQALQGGKLRTFETVRFGERWLALPHDGYFLGGSRAGGTSKGVDCSEWVFKIIRGIDPASAGPSTGTTGTRPEVPSTRQFRLFAQMLKGTEEWDPSKIGGLAAYRGCFEPVDVSTKNPPQVADIAVSISPGNGPGHMTWVLDYEPATGMMQTFEAAGGSTGTVTIKSRPAFEPPCTQMRPGTLVPRADLVFLRPRSNPDSSCPLVKETAPKPNAP